MKQSIHTLASDLLRGGLVLGLAFAIGCGSGNSPADQGVQGAVANKADGTPFFTEIHRGGNAQEILLNRVRWGRLVDVFGLDGPTNADLVLGVGETREEDVARVPLLEDFVIAGGFTSIPGDFTIERNPVTGQEALVVLRNVNDRRAGGERGEFFSLLAQTEQNLTTLLDQGGGSGIFTMVPRNAALVLQTNDLLDPDFVSSETVRVTSGVPAITPFEARIFPDPNHGGLLDTNGDGVAEFYSTRVIIDTTISEIEAFSVDPPLEVNGIGLPASVDVNQSNLRVAIPTVRFNPIGQEIVLQNLSGHPLSSDSDKNGSVDLTVPTLPVVRAARSGGRADVTADPFNGFLPDNDSPLLVGTQPVVITAITEFEDTGVNEDPELFRVDMTFASLNCAQTPEPGDIVRQPGLFAEVVEEPVPQTQGVVTDVLVRLILFPDTFSSAEDWLDVALTNADFLSTYDAFLDQGKEECFVRITPTPGGFPEEQGLGLRTNSEITLRFNEPMDPSSLTAFDSMTLTRRETPQNNSHYVVGTVDQTMDLQEFTFDPSFPLAHTNGTSETYYLTLNSGQFGPTDLSGNGLSFVLPQIILSIDSDEDTERNGGRVTRFSMPDEDAPFGDQMTGPLPEWTGQFFYDLPRQLIRPRPVTRFTVLADRSQAMIGLMTPFMQGIATPLTPLGAKLQAIWRYVDVGFSLTDVSRHDVDVEGISWAPAGGQPSADHFGQFEIRMSHCRHAPDEIIDPGSLFPDHQLSGLKPTFNANIMNPQLEPQIVVHPRERGYTIDPGDSYQASSGTRLMPWPMNQDPTQDPIRFTWRNTELGSHRSGNQNEGVDPGQLGVALGTEVEKVYNTGEIQTIGLPLLIEYRCFPDQGAIGLNALDISLAANSSSRPWFRGFSSGGFGGGGAINRIDPDLETQANGGYNPGSSPPGAPTPALDNVVYIGAIDIVVRVSHALSIWFEASNPNGTGGFDDPSYSPIVVEPDADERPFGTDIRFAFRGALTVGGSMAEAARDANTLDIYGNHYAAGGDGTSNPHDQSRENPTIAFFQANNEWTDFDPTSSDPLGINGAPYYQMRVTFFSNVETGLVAELSAVAVSWEQE